MMNAKILTKKTSSFGGVKYNEDKREEGFSSLAGFQNFPSHINEKSSKDDIKDYLKAVSVNNNMKNKQFHGMISARGREHSKEELIKVAKLYMGKMGYGKQPYAMWFHNDTSNNHLHIVSSRVDVESGKRINQDYEKLKSLTAMNEIMKQEYGIDYKDKINNLKSFSVDNKNQFKLLFTQNGFEIREKDGVLNVYKDAKKLDSISEKDIVIKESLDSQRKKELIGIIGRFQKDFSNKVFAVKSDDFNVDKYVSEMGSMLKSKMGVEIVFSYKDDKKPFGYTIIDNKNKTVFKGSDIKKMKTVFDITDESLISKNFNLLENFNIKDEKEKEALIHYFKNKEGLELKPFMLFKNTKPIKKNILNDTKNGLLSLIKNNDIMTPSVNDVVVFNYKGEGYVVNDRENKLFKISEVLNKRELLEFNKDDKREDFTKNNNEEGSSSSKSKEGGLDDDLNDSSLTFNKGETGMDFNIGDFKGLEKILAEASSVGEDDENQNKKKQNKKRKRRR